MYANSMLIILPNDMSCCWQETAEGGKEGGRWRYKIPVLCSDVNIVNYFITFFVAVDLSSILSYEHALFH